MKQFPWNLFSYNFLENYFHTISLNLTFIQFPWKIFQTIFLNVIFIQFPWSLFWCNSHYFPGYYFHTTVLIFLDYFYTISRKTILMQFSCKLFSYNFSKRYYHTFFLNIIFIQLSWFSMTLFSYNFLDLSGQGNLLFSQIIEFVKTINVQYVSNNFFPLSKISHWLENIMKLQNCNNSVTAINIILHRLH